MIDKYNLIESQNNFIQGLVDIGFGQEKGEGANAYHIIYHNAIEIILQTLEVDQCELFTYDEYGEKLVLRASSSPVLEKKIHSADEKPYTYNRGESMPGWTFKTGKPLFIPDTSRLKENGIIELTPEMLIDMSDGMEINDEDRILKWVNKKGEPIRDPKKRVMIYPIKYSDGSVIGVIRCSAPSQPEIKNFSDQKEQLKGLSNITSSILYEIQQKKLNNLLVKIAKIQEKKTLFETVVENLTFIIRGRGCSLFLLDEEKKYFRLEETNSHVMKNSIQKVPRYKAGEGKTGLTAEIGHLLVINYYGTGKLDIDRLGKNYKKYKEKEKKGECLVEYLKNETGNKVGLILLLKIRKNEIFTTEASKVFRKFAKEKCPFKKNGLTSEQTCETSDISSKGEEKQIFTRSYIAAALTIGQEVVGVIRIPRTYEGGIFTHGEIDLMRLVVDRLCLQLESERYLHTIIKINRDIDQSKSLSDIYKAILQAATDTLGFEFATIQLADYKKNVIWTEDGRKNPAIKNAVNPSNWIPKKPIDLNRVPYHGVNYLNPPAEEKKDIHAWLLEEHQKDIIISGWDDHFDPDIYKQYKHEKLIRAFIRIIAIDPKRNEIKIGTLEAGNDISRKNYTSDKEMEMLKALANLAAIAIINFKLQEDNRKHQELETWVKFARLAVHRFGTIGNIFENKWVWITEAHERLGVNNDADITLLSEHINDTIKDMKNLLMEYKRETSFSTVLEQKKFNIVSTIKDSFKQLKFTGNKTTKTELTLFPAGVNSVIFYGDETKFYQAFLEIFCNCKKYGVTNNNLDLKIRIYKNNGHLLIEIQDSGQGINPKIIDKMFEIGETIDKKSGTGFGLTSVRDIIKVHGGKIYANNSQPPKTGSIFKIILPIRPLL